ncbi:hypothetical protein J2Y38_002036 [Flavobacterium sp. 2755]|uniref:hypothetical protein n=1 Tax=Flavobacterium sp. 2755 TaxID=2817765 RepID=UPI002862B3E6|nr:hypothetical protein [Flavobacterium sp. 2755]MDR6761827.1 hypothetical protein [Flavobacterium sp. 2755]
MSVNLHSVDNAEKPQSEFVWIEATAKTNMKGYALVDRTFNSSDKVSNEFRHIFIFPDLEVEKGEWIRICTGNGKYEKVKSTSGAYVHKLFWNSSECVWNNNGGDTATLIKYSVIKSVKVAAVKK